MKRDVVSDETINPSTPARGPVAPKKSRAQNWGTTRDFFWKPFVTNGWKEVARLLESLLYPNARDPNVGIWRRLEEAGRAPDLRSQILWIASRVAYPILFQP